MFHHGAVQSDLPAGDGPAGRNGGMARVETEAGLRHLTEFTTLTIRFHCNHSDRVHAPGTDRSPSSLNRVLPTLPMTSSGRAAPVLLWPTDCINSERKGNGHENQDEREGWTDRHIRESLG